MNNLSLTSFSFRALFLVTSFLLVCLPALRGVAQGEPPAKPSIVTFFGKGTSPISSGVAVPEGKTHYYTSGIGAPVLDPAAPVGSATRYGDTKTQAIRVLNQIQMNLKEVGLGLQDVTFLRVYVSPDAHKENKPDFPGWFAAYAQFFGTPENPVKVARSTVGVASLANPDWLIEIEAVAVFPDAKAQGSPIQR